MLRKVHFHVASVDFSTGWTRDCSYARMSGAKQSQHGCGKVQEKFIPGFQYQIVLMFGVPNVLPLLFLSQMFAVLHS